MVKEQKQRDYHAASRSLWSKKRANFFINNYIEYAINRHIEPKEEYVKDIIPIIPAAGLNERFGEISKCLQPILGTPCITRIIKQLKSTGFREEDIYVVTPLDFKYPYRSEVFFYFNRGAGKELGVNNITFRKPLLNPLEVVKSFANGEVTEAVYDFPAWNFVPKEIPPKKNLMVIHADNVFYSEAPMRWFVERGGEVLNDESKGCCVFKMIKIESEEPQIKELIRDLTDNAPFAKRGKAGFDSETYNYTPITGPNITIHEFKETKDICAGLFEREACKKLAVPEFEVAMSAYIAKEIEKEGKSSEWLESGSYFFNINDTQLYNTALFAEAARRCLNYIDDSSLNKRIKVISDAIHTPLRISDFGKKNTAIGQYIGEESGLEVYLKECGLDHGENDPVIKWSFMDQIRYGDFCFFLGLYIASDETTFLGRVLKKEAEEDVERFIKINQKTAPELEKYVGRAVEWGKMNTEKIEEHIKENIKSEHGK